MDRDKVLKQGVPLTDVYQTLQTFMGGPSSTTSTASGGSGRFTCRPRASTARAPRTSASSTCATARGDMVPLSALTTVETRLGPEFIMRYNLYRSAQINAAAAPGYSSAQAMEALEEVFAQTMPREMGYGYLGMSFQEKQAQQGVPPAAIFALSLLFVFLILAALYESWSLPFSVLLCTPIAVFGAFALLWAPADGEQRLRPDRAGHAHRPRRQERDPDRRVRQDAARARQAAHRGRAGRRAAAACGRS